MHYIVDPEPLTSTGLTILPGGGPSSFGPYPLVKPATTGFARNRRGYQSPEASEQFTSGDNRAIIGERSIDLILEGSSVADAHAKLSTFLSVIDTLSTAGEFTLEYAGTTLACVGTRGVTSWQPIGNGNSIRVTFTYLPKYQYATLTGTSTRALGPL